MAMNNNQLSDLTKKLKQSAILYQGKKVIDMKPFINFISNDLGLKKQDAMELGKAFNLEAELNQDEIIDVVDLTKLQETL